MPARVVMYRTPYCGYCMLAKRLLTKKGAVFEEIDVSRDPEQRARLREVTGMHTVPQIFVDDRPIGGYLELHLLERAGKLDALLAGE
ncbi:MAG: glutaredoxin 3 [Myxococcales bacterium]|nr:glutaredoxin 3 [Myxococcales bacterium]